MIATGRDRITEIDMDHEAMNVTLPFPVVCSHVKSGKRSYNLDYVVFEDSFEVREVPASETVVAAKVMFDGVAEEVYRFHEGKFYRPASVSWSESETGERNFPDDVSNLELGAALVNGGKPLVPGELYVLHPELFNYDDEADNLVRSADQILTMTQTELRGATKSFVDAWHDMDVAVEKGLKSLEQCVTDDIERGMAILQTGSKNNKV